MARVAGVNIPDSKRLVIALRYIYGIGPVNAVDVCNKAGIDQNIRVSNLSDEDLKVIQEVISGYQVEGDLRKKISMDIKRLISIKCYRGRRHVDRLPVRGQRTRTNARTVKGRAIPVAGKKKAKK